jgi:hypothetical protein
MLDDVIVNYLQTLDEREFDAPFIALLRASGFSDIHFLHGTFEFGKDFIAKRMEGATRYQWTFQTKAGDLDLNAWHHIRGQIDLLRTANLAHSAFDSTLPRQAVLVTTGRLIGAAPLAAQDYARHLEALHETGFVVWDRDTLTTDIKNSLEVVLGGTVDGALLSVVGKVESRELFDFDIERFSRRWIAKHTQGLWRAALEAAVLAQRLRRLDRLDLACYTAACFLRAVLAASPNQMGQNRGRPSALHTARDLFRHYAIDLRSRCIVSGINPRDIILKNEPLTAIVTYPVRCLRIIEILGLLGLLEHQTNAAAALQTASLLESFVRANPGAAHPISDRWAVSLIPPILLLALSDARQTAVELLRDTIQWVADHYESPRFGLAAHDAGPDVEINYLVGSSLEHIDLSRRTESYLSTVVLDLAAVLGAAELYELARNEFLAVGINSCLVESPDTSGQYMVDSPNLVLEPNVRYANTWMADGQVAPHHRPAKAGYPEVSGGAWDQLVLSTVLRDRHSVSAWRRLLCTPPK